MIISTTPVALDREIRHLGPDDILASVSISNVTRQLSERDYRLADKFNEMLAELQAFSQPIPIVLPPVSLSALASERIGNFRIPQNYTVSVVNASVASSPVASSATLDIIYSAGTYGNSDGGTTLVSTSGEYAIAGDSVGEGELIFKVTSTATHRQSITASVLLQLKQVA